MADPMTTQNGAQFINGAWQMPNAQGGGGANGMSGGSGLQTLAGNNNNNYGYDPSQYGSYGNVTATTPGSGMGPQSINNQRFDQFFKSSWNQ